jgi:hypothetical protein
MDLRSTASWKSHINYTAIQDKMEIFITEDICLTRKEGPGICLQCLIDLYLFFLFLLIDNIPETISKA